MPQPHQDKSLGNRRIFISPCPLISFGGSYLEILAGDKKGSIFYVNEINRIPPADRTTGIEVSGTTGSQINQIRCVGARGVPSTPSLEEQPLYCTHGLFRSERCSPRCLLTLRGASSAHLPSSAHCVSRAKVRCIPLGTPPPLLGSLISPKCPYEAPSYWKPSSSQELV